MKILISNCNPACSKIGSGFMAVMVSPGWNLCRPRLESCHLCDPQVAGGVFQRRQLPSHHSRRDLR